MLIDRGLLARENGRWTVSQSASEIDVPDSVQALLAARIDLLDPTDKEALQTAAVIGRVFWTGPVYELLAGEPDFRALEERDFIRLRSGSSIPGQREYAIKHALTREVAYASLPRARRARLHAGFAAWLERFAGASGDELAPLLAHHYAEAVRPEDVDLAWSGEEAELAKLRESAILWLRRAAELAVGRYEIDEGLILLHRAVALEPDPRKQAKLWEKIGQANVLRFAGEDFRAAMENAIELAGPSAELYTELALQTARRTGMWQQAPDRELVDGWIERALELVEEGSRRTRRHSLQSRSGGRTKLPHALCTRSPCSRGTSRSVRARSPHSPTSPGVPVTSSRPTSGWRSGSHSSPCSSTPMTATSPTRAHSRSISLPAGCRQRRETARCSWRWSRA